MATKQADSCSWTTTPHQWISILILAGSSASFYSISAADIDSQESMGMVAGYSVLLALVLGFAIVTTRMDPSDLAVKLKKDSQHDPALLDRIKYPRDCSLCATRVEAESRHCRRCKRCIADFDHHCKWLNNCIGRANYRWFICLIVTLEGFSAFYVYFAIRVLILAFENGAEGEAVTVRYTQKYSTDAVGYTLIGLMTVMTAGWIAIFVFNGYLLAFHLFLKYSKQSTYAYVVQTRKKNIQIYPISMKDNYVLEMSPSFVNTPKKNELLSAMKTAIAGDIAGNGNESGINGKAAPEGN